MIVILPSTLVFDKRSLFHFVWIRLRGVRDRLAPLQVFNAVLSSAFSAPA